MGAKRWALVAVALLALAAGGMALYIGSRPDIAPMPAATPIEDVALLRCVDGGTELIGEPEILVQSDGIHFVIDNRDGARQYYFTLKHDKDDNNGGPLEPGINRIETDLPPGLLSATCMYRPSEFDTHFVDLQVIDPKERYIPVDLSCELPTESRTKVPKEPDDDYVPADPEGFVREHVSGLAPTDLIVKPGYSDTQWHSDVHIIARGGQTVAEVNVWSSGAKWEVVVNSCDGSGIGAS